MEKILIVGCRMAMDDVCIGCSRCLTAFNRRVGGFSGYGEAEILGLLSCGGCPGAVIVTRLAQVKLWNAPMNEKPTVVHIAPCIADHCPHADGIMAKIKAKCGIPVVVGTHPFMPADIFS
ncbi:CGGC domain-containing protein [Desulfolutivibrio sulfoxidireducens]|uniref:CGGC domain-containing protein n=1 Tax=Desulfolutivibrio sulfoxidireducens TaxID=2773299 RepID=UPI00159CF337|nr:CGGC domain-containing protein [Desulfolutivibrio sulfoxidireducens]QLA14806.1 CGGC domain-containing protein [Desulfolutivibrio sulfoxidireducens]QLA18378.1 CGGC domain-containing protein [Desulfolutivibrio sulfoxidireducens]